MALSHRRYKSPHFADFISHQAFYGKFIMAHNDPLIGRTLRNEYTIESELGVGGMGAVYLARQKSLNRVVAIKVMNPHIAREAGFSERFTREAQTSARLEHPNIVPIYDYGQEDGYVYLVMRLLNGGSLTEWLSARNQLPSLPDVIRLIRPIASALDYAHNKSVIHRDMKPSNIMFDENNTPYIVDFGIAKLMTANTGITGTGMTIGTPNFMPPEQWRGDPITPSADQYALAVIVYNILTGKMPFEGDTPFVLMHKHMNEYPTPPHEYRADLPAHISGVLLRALAKNSQARFASCSAFVTALETAESADEGVATNVYPMSPTPAKISSQGKNPVPTGNRRTLIPLVGGVVVVFLIGLVIILSGGGLSPTTQTTPTAPSVVILPTDTPLPNTPTDTPTVDVLTAIAYIDETNTAQAPLLQTAQAFSPTPDLTTTIEAIMANRTATQAIIVSIATNNAQKEVDQAQTATQQAVSNIAQQAQIDQIATQAELDRIATQLSVDATATATQWTPTPTPTPTATTADITILGLVALPANSSLKLREYPNLTAEVLRSLPSGAMLMVTHRNRYADWLYVSYQSPEGWVMLGWVSAIFMDVTDSNQQPIVVRDVLPLLSDDTAGYISGIEPTATNTRYPTYTPVP
jgi:serine/threonine protein kinase